MKKSVVYHNTLRSREYRVNKSDLCKLFGIPQESIVDINYDGGILQIFTESRIKEDKID